VDRRRFVLLLGAWWLAIAVPGIITAAVLGSLWDSSGNWIVAVWIAGYLLQLWLFTVLSRGVRGSTHSSWMFVVSLLPWVVDWLPLAGALLVIPAVALAMLFGVWMWRTATRSAGLLGHGIRATGTVVEVVRPFMNVVINRVYIRRTLRLRIEREDGVAPYEAKFRSTFMLGEIPDVGDTLNLRIDPDRPQHFAVDSGGDSAPRAERHDADAAPQHDAGPDHAARLGELDQLRRSGAITEDEYQAQRHAIISSV
jgi:hypothetical protein